MQPVRSFDMDLAPLDHPISRKEFQKWLDDPEMIQMLEDVQIDPSTKFEIFDVLDVDMNTELSLEELIGGLMRLRGSICKSDIIAIRMKVRYLTSMVEDIWHRTCGDKLDPPAVDSDILVGCVTSHVDQHG